MDAPGKYTVEISIEVDDSGFARAVEITNELCEVAEQLQKTMAKASSLLESIHR